MTLPVVNLSPAQLGVTGGVIKEIFFPVNWSGVRDDYPTVSIQQNGDGEFGFQVPADFVSLTELALIATKRSGPGGNEDIDLFSNYGEVGESNTFNSESDTTSVYTFPATNDEFFEIDISSVFNSLARSDIAALLLDQNGVGTTVDYYALRMRYAT